MFLSYVRSGKFCQISGSCGTSVIDNSVVYVFLDVFCEKEAKQRCDTYKGFLQNELLCVFYNNQSLRKN